MRSIRSRPICRAHNTFSPAIALWQHFVAPNQHLPQRPRQSSIATAAAPSRREDGVGSSSDHGESAARPNRIPVREIDGHVVRKIYPDDADSRAAEPGWRSLRKTRVLAPRQIKGCDDPYTAKRLRLPQQRENALRNDGGSDKVVLRPYRGEQGQDVDELLIKAREAYVSLQDYRGEVILPKLSPEQYASPDLPWHVRDENITATERYVTMCRRIKEHLLTLSAQAEPRNTQVPRLHSTEPSRERRSRARYRTSAKTCSKEPSGL